LRFVERNTRAARRARAGIPSPPWETNGFTTVIFRSNPKVRAIAEAQVTEQVAGEAGTKLALSRH